MNVLYLTKKEEEELVEFAICELEQWTKKKEQRKTDYTNQRQ